MTTLEELEKRILTLEKAVEDQEKFRKKFDPILSLRVRKTEYGRVSLRDTSGRSKDDS